MLKIFNKLASYHVIIVLSVIFLSFMLYLFPTYQAEISKILGKKFTSFDAQFSYGKTDALLLLEEIGIEGRKKYSFISGVIDMVYPFVYSLLFSLLIFKSTDQINYSKIRLTSFIPITAAIFDYLENFCVLNMIKNYPNLSDSHVQFSSICTSIKWILIAISLLLTIGFSIYKLMKPSRKNETHK